jgi:hypothetical protein
LKSKNKLLFLKNASLCKKFIDFFGSNGTKKPHNMINNGIEANKKQE